MTDFSTFNRHNLDTLRKEITATLDLLELDGVSFDLGTLRFSPTEVKVTLTITNAGRADKEASDLRAVVNAYGLKGTEGTGGELLVGYNARAPRFPFLVHKTDGKTYKYTEKLARQTFGEV